MAGPVFVSDCPRCSSKNMTFDVLGGIKSKRRYEWQRGYEVFCVCRHCDTSTTFVISQRADADEKYLANHDLMQIEGSLNEFFSSDGFICIKDVGAASPPEFVPDLIANAFREGATSVVTNCPNAAAAMFRLAIDLATEPLLPKDEQSGRPNSRVCRDLGLRLPWLFENNLLPRDLEELSRCIREDGNDGAHRGTLQKADAWDLQDFTTSLLERLYTVPERLRRAAERRTKRRSEDTK